MNVVIVGAGGQARVVYEILSYDHNAKVGAFLDYVVPKNGENINGIPVVGDHSFIPQLIKNGIDSAIIAIGDNQIRARYFDKLKSVGLKMVNAIHPTSSLSPSVRVGEGVTIAMGAIISTGATVGNNVIINTGAIIEHDNEIGDHVHIGPGCSLAGKVIVKRGTFVGIGSVVKEYITIGENTIIGAGSVVLGDIPDNVVAAGTPARIIKTREKT